MKLTKIIAFIFLSIFTYSIAFAADITVVVRVTDCAKNTPLNMYEFDGLGFKKVKSFQPLDTVTYRFTLPVAPERFYYFGVKEDDVKPVIVGKESYLYFAGSCKGFRQSVTVGYGTNGEYEELMRLTNAKRNEVGELMAQFRSAPDAATYKTATEKLAETDKQKLYLLDSLKKANPFLAQIAAMNTYLSFPNNKGVHADEISYFAADYFKYVDFKNPILGSIPMLFDAFRGYAQTLGSLELPEAKVKGYIDTMLKQVPDNTNVKKFALGGVIMGLGEKQNPAMIPYTEAYKKQFQPTDPQILGWMDEQVKQARTMSVGGAAPDFTQNTPEGAPLSLSKFKGKVTLVDFWASWCGPCRRENPNVVSMYKKYKDKGFDILSVSLDSNKDSWLKAIKDDGLVWNHVSDLKGWQNDAAKLYGVRSIPQTVLVDKDGNVIARNLRGELLEARLDEIFGAKK
jgi:thiol-disulfide isomerase/thioredoxin